MLTIAYIQAIALHIHIKGRFNNHTVHGLYRIMVMANSVMGVMKMGNIVPSLGLETISLAFRVSVLPLHHLGSMITENILVN